MFEKIKDVLSKKEVQKGLAGLVGVGILTTVIKKVASKADEEYVEYYEDEEMEEKEEVEVETEEA